MDRSHPAKPKYRRRRRPPAPPGHPWFRRAFIWLFIFALIGAIADSKDIASAVVRFVRSTTGRRQVTRSTKSFIGLFEVEMQRKAREASIHLNPVYESGFPHKLQVVSSVGVGEYSKDDTVDVWYSKPEGAAAVLINKTETCVAILTGYHVFRSPVEHMGIACDVPQVGLDWTLHALVPQGSGEIAALVEDDRLPGDAGRVGDWRATYGSTGESLGPLLTEGLHSDESFEVGSRDQRIMTSVFPPTQCRDTLTVSLKFDNRHGCFEGTATIDIEVTELDVEGGTEARGLASVEAVQPTVGTRE